MNTILNQLNHLCFSTDRLNREDSPLAHLVRAAPALHPLERPSHTHTPKLDFGGRGHEKIVGRVNGLKRDETVESVSRDQTFRR